MSKKTIGALLLTPAILAVVCLPVYAQTVGDTFIDTSEWVQSSSPIRVNGEARGYITETIVRGYRGPSYDRYYDSAPANSATEFSDQSKIQPVVYESSPSNSTSLEPTLRPTPDPVVQATNFQARQAGAPLTQTQNPYRNAQTERSVNIQATHSVYQSNLRGFSNQGQETPAFNSTLSTGDSTRPVFQTSYTQQPVYPVNQFQYGQSYSYPAPYAGSTPYYTNSFVQTQFATPPASNVGAIRNCCDPIYTQTQFVTPQPNTGAGTLRTYPQYNQNPYNQNLNSQNPYPNSGFGISQPYIRDTWVPMIPLRSMPYGTYLGQGIVGQPVAYVNGEPVRNFLRYIFP